MIPPKKRTAEQAPGTDYVYVALSALWWFVAVPAICLAFVWAGIRYSGTPEKRHLDLTCVEQAGRFECREARP